MAKVQNLTRYETLVQNSTKRRESIQQGIDRSNTIRSAMVGHITTTASNQVTLSEQLLRSRSSAAAKAKLNKLA